MRVDVLYTPYCPIGLIPMRDLARELGLEVVEHNIWKLRESDLPSLPRAVREWVEDAWSGRRGFAPYSRIIFNGRLYDPYALDELRAEVARFRSGEEGGA